MAVKVYYGKCTSASDVPNKAVVVPEIDENTLQEGDLLVVYFSQNNTASEPKIVIYNDTPQNQDSIASDEGRFVKTNDIDIHAAEIWEAGETVIFCYTLETDNIGGNSNTYYWELVEGAPATTDVYGVTKLADVGDNNFTDWIAAAADDETTAVTPAILSKLYNLLIGGEEEEEGLAPSGWEPAREAENPTLLGTLTVVGQPFEITYPLEDEVIRIVGDIPDRTSDLINDGEGVEGLPFITKYIPDDLFFTNGSGLYISGNDTSVAPYITLNDSNNKTLLKGVSGIKLDSPTEVTGVLNTKNIVTTGTLSATGNIISEANIKGVTLYEDNVSLINKYSRKLMVKRYLSPIITLNPNNASSNKGGIIRVNDSETGDGTHWKRNGLGTNHLYVVKSDYDTLLGSSQKDNWEPIGIVGYNIDGTSDGNTSYSDTARYCHVWEMHLWPADSTDSYGRAGTIEYSLFNTMPTTARVVINIYILFRQV